MRTRYAAIGPDMVLRHPLGPVEAVYDRRSGLTHILSDPAPALLDILAAGDADAEQLLARLETLFDLQADDAQDQSGLEAVIAARLAELAELGLIRAVARA